MKPHPWCECLNAKKFQSSDLTCNFFHLSFLGSFIPFSTGKLGSLELNRRFSLLFHFSAKMGPLWRRFRVLSRCPVFDQIRQSPSQHPVESKVPLWFHSRDVTDLTALFFAIWKRKHNVSLKAIVYSVFVDLLFPDQNLINIYHWKCRTSNCFRCIGSCLYKRSKIRWSNSMFD